MIAQRRDWDASELTELLTAHRRMQEAYTTLLRDRVLKKTGLEIPKHPMGAEVSEATRVRLSARVARLLKQDDRTIPLYQLSEEELADLVAECIAGCERESETSLSLREQESVKQCLVLMIHGMSTSEEDPAINYAVVWQWIDAVELWAVQHNKAPLAFFDQSDAHGELTRRTQAKEQFLKEGYSACQSPGALERMQRAIFEPLLELLKSEGLEMSADAEQELSTVVSKSLEEQMGRTYEELVIDADRIYGPDTQALPS